MASKNSLLLCLSFFLVFACSRGPAQPAVVFPYARAFDQPMQQQITVVLDPGIPEAMAYSGAGLRTLTMSDFKTVFKNALTNMFSKNFTGTAFADAKTGKGIELVVFRLEGQWEKIGAVAMGGQVANYEVRPLHKFDIALFVDGEKVVASESQIIGEQSTSSLFNLKPVFIGGVKSLCEEMHRLIFTDEVVKKMSEMLTPSAPDTGGAPASSQDTDTEAPAT